MTGDFKVARRRQFCALCGQLMFEYFRSPDGHFGLVGSVEPLIVPGIEIDVRCPSCGARYRMLERLNAGGQPIERMVGRRHKAESRKRKAEGGRRIPYAETF